MHFSPNITQDDEVKSAVEVEVKSALCNPPKTERRVSFAAIPDCMEIPRQLDACNASLLSSEANSSNNSVNDKAEGNIRSSYQQVESLSSMSPIALIHDIDDMEHRSVRRYSIISMQSLQSMIRL